jgi:hypothetical protein
MLHFSIAREVFLQPERRNQVRQRRHLNLLVSHFSALAGMAEVAAFGLSWVD